MTITALGGELVIPNCVGFYSTRASTNETFDATGEFVAAVYRAQASKSLRYVTFFSGAGVADTATIRIETVGTDGWPTGTLVTTGAEVVTANWSNNTVYRVQLGTDAALTAGTLFAVVFSRTNNNGAFKWRVNFLNGGSAYPRIQVPYCCQKIGATPTWAKNNSALPHLVLEMSDGTYFNYGETTFFTSAAPPYDSSTSTNELGNRIKLPFDCRAIGIGFNDYPSGYSRYLTLYADTGTTPLGESGRIYDAQRDNAYYAFTAAYFTGGAVTLTKDTWYRIAQKSYDTNDCVLNAVCNFSTGREADMGMMQLGTNCYKCSRTYSGGVWGSWANDALRRTALYLIIDGVDVAAAGGGGGGVYGY